MIVAITILSLALLFAVITAWFFWICEKDTGAGYKHLIEVCHRWESAYVAIRKNRDVLKEHNDLLQKQIADLIEEKRPDDQEGGEA